MRAGYTVKTVGLNGSKILEVINFHGENRVLNMGWIFPKTPYRVKDKSSVGVWKLKQIKN